MKTAKAGPPLTIKPPTTLFRWRAKDSTFGLTKTTAERAAELLGINETQLIHRALAEFVSREVPHYDPDFDELTDEHYAAIRASVPQQLRGKVIGSFLDD
ncbi:MAG: hypothetical protein JWQ90_5489 [Hydrocarboniphaga sp.]|uniref:hypothetical protein n=1 Tax=Hydrocarboniphaga sp. TaxID=2033016 RepID=UPI00262F7494|nr:hypothetical protein [Hydrocarboniphaga sp.]MDB5973039.1 hypothetical protein [Hydrocarboniphaga sp.]